MAKRWSWCNTQQVWDGGFSLPCHQLPRLQTLEVHTVTLSSALLRAMFVVVGFEVMLKGRGSPDAPGHQGAELCSWGSRRVNPMSVLAPHLTACAGVPGGSCSKLWMQPDFPSPMMVSRLLAMLCASAPAPWCSPVRQQVRQQF